MGILSDKQIRRDIKIEPFAENEKREGKISYGLSSYGYDIRAGYVFDVFSPIKAKEIDVKNFDKESLVRIDLTPHPKHEWNQETIKLPNNPNPLYRCKECEYTAFVRNVIGEYKSNYCGLEPKLNYILIPPHSFALTETFETLTIPRDILSVVLGKSSYARCGLIVNCTPLEPEWTGKITLELSNTSPLPLRVYAGEGICQCLFFRTDGISEVAMRTLQRRYCSSPLTDTAIRELMQSELLKATCEKSYADKRGRYQGQTGLTLPTVDKVSDKQ